MCYTLVHAEAEPAVQSKNPLGNLHNGPFANSCPGHCPSHWPLSSIFTLGLGNEEVRCCFSLFSLVTQEAGICQGSKLPFAGFPWAGQCMRHFPIFSCDYLSLKPGRFLNFLVCLLFLPSHRNHIAASSQTQAQQAPPRASQSVDAVLTYPQRVHFTGCHLPSCVSVSPISVGSNLPFLHKAFQIQHKNSFLKNKVVVSFNFFFYVWNRGKMFRYRALRRMCVQCFRETEQREQG